MIFIQNINFIPQGIQIKVLNSIGRERYIKKPKEGTNPRGIEISAEALRLCIEKSIQKGYHIPIHWKVPEKLKKYNYEQEIKKRYHN